MKITIWNTLPAWDISYYMEAWPAHNLVLIHDWGCIPKTTGIQEILIYHLMIQMLQLKNGLIL